MKWEQWLVGIMVGGGVLIGGRSTTVLASRLSSRAVTTSQVAPQAVRHKTAKRKVVAKPVRKLKRQRGTKTTAVTATTPTRKVTPTKPATVKTKPRRKLASQPATTTKSTKMTYVTLAGHGSYTQPHIHFKPTADYLKTNGLQNEPSTIKSTKSYLDHYSFKTTFYLPQKLDGRDLSVPQSAAFSADNHYLYVMYVDGKQPTNRHQDGWAVRYDWDKLMALGANRPGKMAMIRKAAQDQARGKLTKLDKKVLACIKVGPKFNSGHAQSLALNLKTNEFWYVKAYDQDTPNVMVRFDPKTLLPSATVTYHSTGAVLGAALTFDDQGHAYYWTHTKVATKNTPLGAVKIFRGTVSTQGIEYQKIPQGLASDPGFYVQSMGYDDTNNRLYLVSDESITSLPLADLGHLKTNQVGENDFGAHREFEGLFFMHHSSNGYLLTNKGTEVMQLIRN